MLNNDVYNAYEDIYLNSGTYTYKISHQGYVEKSGSIKLSDQDNLTYKVYLQKQLDKKIAVSLNINNNSSIKSQILNNIMNNIILNNQMEISNSPQYNINIDFNDIEVNEVSKNFYTIILPISINIYQNNLIKNTIAFNVRYISSKNIKNIPTEFIQKEIQTQSEIFFADLYN